MAFEFLHVVIFSVVYGLLLLVVVTHVLVKWQLRRRSLQQWCSAVPGDASFKRKRMRQQLLNDFRSIATLTSDPRLINRDISPSAFGVPKGSTPGSNTTVYPSHWQRMRGFDAAAEFVAAHIHLLGSNASLSAGQPLPQFLSALQQQQMLTNHSALVQQATDLYKNARTNPGDFTESMHDELTSTLDRLSQCLPAAATRRRQPPITDTGSLARKHSGTRPIDLELFPLTEHTDPRTSTTNTPFSMSGAPRGPGILESPV